MLVARDLRKRYGDVSALDGCSLAVERGRLLGFLGANGAGKTTAMRAVFGLVHLDDGSLSWDDRPIGTRERMRFGYMPEERGLYPRMSAGEQLAYFARLHGVERDEAVRSATDLLDTLGLGDRAGDAVEDLSHGNQQRVQLAAAIVHDPDLLVLDEPFAGLDPLGVDSMAQVLRREVEHDKAVVFSSHQLDLVESICDDVVVVNEGSDVLSGSLDDLRERSGRRRVEIGFVDGVRWKPEEAFPDAEVVDDGPSGLQLSVPRELSPERVLGAAREAGEVSRFAFQPPRLSELFQEAVRS